MADEIRCCGTQDEIARNMTDRRPGITANQIAESWIGHARPIAAEDSTGQILSRPASCTPHTHALEHVNRAHGSTKMVDILVLLRRRQKEKERMERQQQIGSDTVQ